MICAHNGVNPFRGEPVSRVPIKVIAEEFGRPEWTAYREIERGIQHMARLLGWRPKEDEDDDSGRIVGRGSGERRRSMADLIECAWCTRQGCWHGEQG